MLTEGIEELLGDADGILLTLGAAEGRWLGVPLGLPEGEPEGMALTEGACEGWPDGPALTLGDWEVLGELEGALLTEGD